MDRFTQMTVFKAVADAQGFAAAAKQLGMSPPAVTRSIASLENTLNVRLLNRSTRHVSLTEAGERYLSDVRRILDDVKAADDSAAGVNTAPAGELVVTAPVLFGQQYVMPVILEYLDTYSDTSINALFFDHIGNLLEDGIDVAIRIGQLPDSSLRALKVSEVKQQILASPDYINSNGAPSNPAELKQHAIIATDTTGDHVNWSFDSGTSVRLKPRLKVTTNQAAISAAESGLGFTRLLSYQVADAVNRGTLIPVLEQFSPAAYPINIVHREGRFATSKIRSFIDLAAIRLREQLA